MSIDEVLENLNRSLDRVLESLEDDMDVEEYAPEEPPNDKRPCVRIIHAGGEWSWYRDKIGQIIEIIPAEYLPRDITDSVGDNYYFVLDLNTIPEGRRPEETSEKDMTARARLWMTKFGGDIIRKEDCIYYPVR